jgi:serine protease AprX
MVASFGGKEGIYMRLFNSYNIVQMSICTVMASILILCSPVICLYAETDASAKASPADIVRQAVADGKLAFKLTTPDELKALLGPADNETVKNDGGMEILELKYPDIQVIFGRMKRYSTPSTLLWIIVKDKQLDIGQERQIVLRNEDDLKKFDPFWGLANVSLANLDLRGHLQLLETMPFDSQTKWPGPDKLPDGFDPARLLEDGKNPGLGIRALHKQGVDGRGVGIAIIDQPLLKDHIEYADRLVKYRAIDVEGVPVQMHGPPVCSIAVGKTCGVAPGASLYYFAVPMWKPDNQPYCDAIDELIKLNADPNTTERVRAVSISTGMFPQQANFDRWKEALKKAEQNGILVVTCSQDSFQYGMLARIDGKDPDDPASYQSGIYGVRPGAALVPASNRTTAGHTGRDVYTFWREAGMSWATPDLAGLAVLAYQVNPEIEPKTIVTLLQKTAVQTSVGTVVQPENFIKAVRNAKHN